MARCGRDAYLEGNVLSADRTELVEMLYQAALSSTSKAQRYARERDSSAYSAELGTLCAVLAELSRALDHAVGRDLSKTLDGLYRYMGSRLLDASQQPDEQVLEEVSALLRELLDGWSACKEARAVAWS